MAALLCGLAILVAGVIQLFRILDNQDTKVIILEQGRSATVGGLTLSVTGSTQTQRAIEVMARFEPAATEARVPVTSFTLLVGGQLEPPTNGASTAAPGCPPTIVVGSSGASCVVTFSLRQGTATVAFSRAGEQRLWRLEPAVA